jgi:hypothetical protein
MALPLAAAIAIPAAIKGIGSVFGGFQRNKGIKNALNNLLSSYDVAGTRAEMTVNQVNPEVLKDAWHWGDLVHAAGEDAASAATAAAQRGIEGVNTAVTGAQGAVAPYQQAGTDALSTLTNLLQKPQQYQYQADPGYQFRLAEGQKQINRMAAAKGASGGGGTAKALAQYNSGLASQEYQAGWDRWNQEQKQRQSGLGTLAGMGMQAGEYAGDVGMRGAQFNAGLDTQATQYGQNALMNAMQWQGNAGMNAQRWASENTLDLGNFLANLDLQRGKTRAGADLGNAANWADIISQGTGLAADAFGQYSKKKGWI